MSVFDLFRRFFHPPGERDPFFGGITLDDEDDEDDDDFFQRPPGLGFQSPPFQDPFGHQSPPFQDPFGFEDIFRDFHELFAGFGSLTLDAPRFPGIEASGTIPEGHRGESLRDSMLKHPDSHLPRHPASSSRDPETPERPRHHHWPPQWGLGRDSSPPEGSKQDKALDSEVSTRGLDSILSPREPPAVASSYFRSVSVSKVIRPDGTVEERRTVRDGQGNTTTTMTVTRGDEVIGSGSLDSPRDAIIGPPDSAPILPDLSDSQPILSRILQRWFSSR